MDSKTIITMVNNAKTLMPGIKFYLAEFDKGIVPVMDDSLEEAIEAAQHAARNIRGWNCFKYQSIREVGKEEFIQESIAVQNSF